MRIGDKDVSKWTMLMLIGSILMFASFFLSLVGVEVLGEGFAISGLELLSGFDIGIKEIGANDLSFYRYIPAICALVGVLVAALSFASLFNEVDNKRLMTGVSITLTITLLLQVIFLMGGTSIELFTGSVKNMLNGLGSTFRPMFGIYLSVISTFITGMASTYRMRECL